MHTRYDKIDGFIKIHDRIRFSVLLDCGWFDKACDKIKYLISKKEVLQIVFVIILQESELIRITLYLLKIYGSSECYNTH